MSNKTIPGSPSPMFPATHTADQIVTEIETRLSSRNLNVGRTWSAVLADRPKSLKVATLMEILKVAEGGEFHHYALKIASFKKDSNGYWNKPENTISIGAKGEDEIVHLLDLLETMKRNALPKREGISYILSADAYSRYADVVDALSNAPLNTRIEMIVGLVKSLSTAAVRDVDFLKSIQNTSGEVLVELAAAMKMVGYRKALAAFKLMVVNNSLTEAAFQSFLESNSWMFGAEYEVSLKRKWTRDEQLDFMFKLTADNYLEIVEIKTPDVKLFSEDKKHNTYYPTAELSKAVAQTIRYIERMEEDRTSIRARDAEDPLKIRAKLIIGRDATGPEAESQRQALRNYNGHLHRIEILTYDHLIRIAERVLTNFSSVPAPQSG